MAGRPKYTPDTVERVISALRSGCTRRAACGHGRISEDTFARWLARYADFADAVKTAEADAETQFTAVVARAARDGTWQAAAWWLERRRHEDWRKREDISHGNQDGAPLRIEVVRPTVGAGDVARIVSGTGGDSEQD